MAQIFHPSTKTISRLTIFGGITLLSVLVSVLAAIDRSSYVTEVGVARAQPVPFRHKHHVAAFCRYCRDFSIPSSLSGGTSFMKSAQVLPLKSYTAVFAALLGLTLMTTAVSLIDLGSLNVVFALTIAIGKALLVLLYFMHVRYSSRLTWVFAGAGFFWLAILITLITSDVLTRN